MTAAQTEQQAGPDTPNPGAPREFEPVLPRAAWQQWFADRPRIADVFVIVACTVPTVIALTVNTLPHAWAGVVCAVGVGVALWWRRSHPMAVLLIIVFLGSINPVAAIAAAPALWERCFGLYALATQRRLRTAVLGFFASEAVVLAATAIMTLLGLRDRWPILPLQPTVLAAIAIGVAVRASRARREALAVLVAAREDRAAAAERSRITAEMHDVVAHSVTVMVALAGGASAGWEKHPERARQALDQLGAVGAQTLQEMQRILRVLRTSDAGLDGQLEASGHNVPDLGELVEGFRAAGLPVCLAEETAEAVAAGAPASEATASDTMPNDPALRTTVFRIVQESLTNALRYARGATLVEVRVMHAAEEVIVTVTDNGRGSEAESHGSARDLNSRQGAGYGLAAMRERAAAFGGSLAAGPIPRTAASPSRGWRVRVVLPRDGDRA